MSMKGSIRRAAGGVGVLALALTAAATAGAKPLVSGVHQQTAKEARVEARSLAFPPTVHQCLKLIAIRCYSPAQLRAAYNLGSAVRRGQRPARARRSRSSTRSARRRSSTTSTSSTSTFGLPDTAVRQSSQPAGAVPPFDPTNGDHVGWAQESTLDVEAAHAIAPGANILLVETPVAETEGVTGFPEMSRPRTT